MAQSVQIKDRTSNANLSINSDGSLNSVVSGTITTTPSGTQNVAITSPAIVPVSGTVTTVPSGTQNVAVTSPAVFPVSGTVTTVPSGTQAVTGTVTVIPSGTQAVSGTVTALPSGTQVVSGSVSDYPVINPSYTGTYTFNTADMAGVVAANVFLSLFNPLLSGKTMVLLGGSVSSYLDSGASTTRISLRGLLITSATLGTLQSSTAIAKRISSYANPVAEVRLGNPTVTSGAAWFSVPPPAQPATNNYIYRVVPPGGAGPLTFAPGEGICFSTSTGDTDQNWNINLVWGEF